MSSGIQVAITNCLKLVLQPKIRPRFFEVSAILSTIMVKKRASNRFQNNEGNFTVGNSWFVNIAKRFWISLQTILYVWASFYFNIQFVFSIQQVDGIKIIFDGSISSHSWLILFFNLYLHPNPIQAKQSRLKAEATLTCWLIVDHKILSV